MATRFLDGPAEGANLSLRRCPYFIRVVVDELGGVDALDQLDDTVRPGETAYVYVLRDVPTHAIACTRGKGCRSLVIAEYRLHEEQPSQDTLRDNASWQEWAADQGKTQESQ